MFIGVTVHAVLFIDTIHQKKSVLRFIVRERTVNGIEDSDRDAKDALSKLLQMGTMAEYENKFVILANRVTWISENLLKSLYISGLKPTLQCAFLRSKPTTLGEAFSLARATEARFTEDALSKLLQMGTVAKYQNEFEMLIKRVTRISEFLLKSFYISRLKPALQIELLRAKPTTLVEAFSLARMIEARFKDKRNTTTIVNPNDLNIAIPDQVLEESILHMSDKVEITSDNDAQDQASEVETNVLVDGKQDDAKVMKVVGVVVKQNNDKPNVLKGNGVIGVGVNEISKWVDKEVQYPVSTLHVRILLLKRLNDKHIKKKKMKAEIQRRIWNPGIKIIFFRHHLVDKVFSKEWRVLRQCCRRTDGPNSPRGRSPIPGQGFDPHSLRGRRSFPTFGRTGSSLSALCRGITVYVSTSPIHRATVLGPITRARRVEPRVPICKRRTISPRNIPPNTDLPENAFRHVTMKKNMRGIFSRRITYRTNIRIQNNTSFDKIQSSRETVKAGSPCENINLLRDEFNPPSSNIHGGRNNSSKEDRTSFTRKSPSSIVTAVEFNHQVRDG
ncbi:ribonuclease H-like domain-containing protein [Tanacetum coccineum]